MKAYIEIKKHSNIKYEYDSIQEKLIVDRILDYPYFYPYHYGFIINTLADDNDELDVLIITDNDFDLGSIVEINVVGALVMEDEKGMDEKIIAVSKNNNPNNINDLKDLNADILTDIKWFFENYKSKDKNRWSKVHYFINKPKTLEIIEKSFNKFVEKLA